MSLSDKALVAGGMLAMLRENKSRKVLVTGANGFVGRALCEELAANGVDVLGVSRGDIAKKASPATIVRDINSSTDWAGVLGGVEVIFHLAARVHVMNEHVDDPLQEFIETNHLGTVNLAKQAAAAGVKRFVYLSSIKVNGEFTSELPFSSLDTPNPQDDYGVSKLKAEQALLDLSKKIERL